MNERIASLGLTKTIILITAFSIISSLIITAIAMHLMEVSQQMTSTTYIIATLVPLIVAPIVGFVLVNSLIKVHELEKEMRALATVDYLTKLLSRRAWIQQAEKYIQLAKRSSSNYSILMIDLDNFKAINDQYGHIAGDKVLVEFSQIVSKLCRSSDFSARFGGEEFIILLPDTSVQQAQHFTDRLHNAIRKLVISHDNNDITFTISIGISLQCTNEDGENCNIDTLISKSDDALYQAKRQGKNCTYVYSPDSK